MKKAGRERGDGSLPGVPYPACSQRTKLLCRGFSRVHLHDCHQLMGASGKTRALDREGNRRSLG